MRPSRNVLGTELEPCGIQPMTGYYRTGCCDVGPDDYGVHGVCCLLTAEFLAFSKAVGNDLTSPRPEVGFPGLKPGDRWCVCASRWQEAYEAGIAPPVFLEATNEYVLEFMDKQSLIEKGVKCV